MTGWPAASLIPSSGRLRGRRPTSNLLLFPLAVMVLAVFVFLLPAAAAGVLVVLASCPVRINVPFVVAPKGDGARLVNSSILLSSLTCALTMPSWLWLLRHA